MSVALAIVAFWPAYSNGTNEALTTHSMLAGSALSLLMASTLAKAFRGIRLGPSALPGIPSLLIAVLDS